MSDDRRGNRRAPIAGVRVTYESSTGERVEADVVDLASGGLFIRTDKSLGVGKRIAVDIHVVGEPAPWSALGRVVWVRADLEAPDRPPGMGVKLIDVDDATLQAIERLVDTREPTAPGVGDVPAVEAVASVAPAVPVTVAPARERTLLGVGATSDPPPPLAPSPTPAVAAPASPSPSPPPPAPSSPSPSPPPESSPPPPAEVTAARERSMVIDVAAQEAVPPAAIARPAPKSVPAPPPPEPSGSPARWVVIVLLLVVAGVAAYVLIDGFLRPVTH